VAAVEGFGGVSLLLRRLRTITSKKGPRPLGLASGLLGTSTSGRSAMSCSHRLPPSPHFGDIGGEAVPPRPCDESARPPTVLPDYGGSLASAIAISERQRPATTRAGVAH